jgi:hypothetical protein
MSEEFVPDWENSDSWDEFEWEQALKYSDHVAARYFRMLGRFGDLPEGEDFIVAKLGDQNFFDFEDADFFVDGAWDEDDMLGEAEEGDEPENADEPDDLLAPGDSLFFETSPVYQRARQISLGWCNIVASVLGDEDRYWGVEMLFHFGRILSFLAISVGDGTFDCVPRSVAFTKRALYQVNVLLGEIDSKGQECPKYAAMFDLIRDHLMETHDMLVTYLCELRNRGENTF